MSYQHKHPTISFRISDAERRQIEARILASGMMKKDYFVRSCIYNRICVVGKKETIYPLVQTVNALYLQLLETQKAFTSTSTSDMLPSSDEIKELQTEYTTMLTAIIDLLDGLFRNYPLLLLYPMYLNFASSNCLPHLPYIVRFIIFNLLLVPSTNPLL